MTKDENLPAEAQALDASYASAAEFDAKMMNEWVAAKFEQFTKRTDYPKLGYLINRLNDLGIASIVYGNSFHAPILYVEKGKLDEAWSVLNRFIDELDDDDPSFAAYADEQPDTDLYE